jgi:hypothetical protein
MFDSILLNEQGLWIVIAVFYVLDNVKKTEEQKLIFNETWRFGWRATLPSNSLTLRNRRICFLPILLPYVLTVQLDWLTAEPASPSQTRRADRQLWVAQRRATSLRAISLIAFFTFFTIGPLLTYWRGLTFAVIEVLPVYVGMLVALQLTLFCDRRFWKLHPSQIIYAVIEAAICPAYLVNVTHRVSWRCIRLNVDGAAYGMLRSSVAPRRGVG